MASCVWILATLVVGLVLFSEHRMEALAECTWKEVRDTSILGGKYTSAASLSECQSKCEAAIECESFDWDSKGSCKLHRIQDGQVITPGSLHFDIECPTDSCSFNPCKNGGRFVLEPVTYSFTCVCINSYSGSNCELPPECTWTQSGDTVVPNGILIPGALTLEACLDACQRIPGCRYFDWISDLQSCYLPVQPVAHRYVLNCGAETQATTENPNPLSTTNEQPASTTNELPQPTTNEEPPPTTTLGPPPTTNSEPPPTTTLGPPPTTKTEPPPTTTFGTPPTTKTEPPPTTTLGTPPTTKTEPPPTTTVGPPATTTTEPPPKTSRKPTKSTISTPKPTRIPVCKVKLDLAFVVDGSTSICNSVFACKNWDFNVEFIRKIVAGLTVGRNDTRVALIMFSTDATTLWDLNEYNNKDSLQSAVKGLTDLYPSGSTNTTGALNTLLSDIFIPTAGDRPDVADVSILITDGVPNIDFDQLPNAIRAVNDRGIKVLVVGVTQLVNEATVKQLSSAPQQANVTYFLASDYSQIDLVREELHKQTCASEEN